jgi:hypothetical protein
MKISNLLISLIFLMPLCFISNSAVAWSLFGPSNFEECSTEAAKDANNKDSLKLLLEICETEFPGQKGQDGKYYFYSFSAGSIEVSGPKLSQKDLENIRAIEKSAKEEKERIADEKKRITDEIAQKAADAQDRAIREYRTKRSATLSNLKILDWNYECRSREKNCDVTSVNALIENNSENIVESIGLGFTVFTSPGDCSQNLRQISVIRIKIPRFEKARISIPKEDLYSQPEPQLPVSGCLAITDVSIFNTNN